MIDIERNDPVLSVAGQLAAEVYVDLELVPAMAIRAVVVVNMMDVEGERQLLVCRDAGMQDWELRGMLSEVLSDLSAFTVASLLEDEDEDEEQD